MSNERANQTSSGTSVLLVGLTPDVLARVTKFLAPHGIEARATTLVKLQADTAQFTPIVVLVDAYLYDFDNQAFDKLALDVGAKLGVVSNSKEAEEMLTALLAPTPPKQIEADEPVVAAPRREFDTAKYDAKTIQDALERMGTNRPEFTTAKYDAKTLQDALERMNPTPSDRETGTYNAQELQDAIKRLKES